MRHRPYLKLKFDTIDKFIEVLGWLVIIGIWIMVFINYSDLPETIPTHFDTKGKADRFGSKDNMLTLQSVLTLLFIGMTILISFPHKLNYAVQITEKNAKFQYTLASRLIRVLKLVIALIFGLLFTKTIVNAKGVDYGFGLFLLPLTIGLFIIPIIIYLIKSTRNK